MEDQLMNILQNLPTSHQLSSYLPFGIVAMLCVPLIIFFWAAYGNLFYLFEERIPDILEEEARRLGHLFAYVVYIIFVIIYSVFKCCSIGFKNERMDNQPRHEIAGN